MLHAAALKKIKAKEEEAKRLLDENKQLQPAQVRSRRNLGASSARSRYNLAPTRLESRRGTISLPISA